jgi:hypothetical protein
MSSLTPSQLLTQGIAPRLHYDSAVAQIVAAHGEFIPIPVTEINGSYAATRQNSLTDPGRPGARVAHCHYRAGTRFHLRQVGRVHPKTRQIEKPGYGPHGVAEHARSPAHDPRLPLEANVTTLISNPRAGLPATARLILGYLTEHPSGARVEDIALNTGSRYRWTETSVLRLHHDGLLQRVGPNTYALPAVQ